MILVLLLIAVVFAIRFIMDLGKHVSPARYANALRKLRISKSDNIIAKNFIDSKHLFVSLTHQLPNVLLITDIDVNQATKMIEDKAGINVKAVYKHRQFDFERNRPLFNVMIMVTYDKQIVEIGSGYVELLYTPEHTLWADKLGQDLSQFRIEKATAVLTSDVRIAGFAGRMN